MHSCGDLVDCIHKSAWYHECMYDKQYRQPAWAIKRILDDWGYPSDGNRPKITNLLQYILMEWAQRSGYEISIVPKSETDPVREWRDVQQEDMKELYMPELYRCIDDVYHKSRAFVHELGSTCNGKNVENTWNELINHWLPDVLYKSVYYPTFAHAVPQLQRKSKKWVELFQTFQLVHTAQADDIMRTKSPDLCLERVIAQSMMLGPNSVDWNALCISCGLLPILHSSM